MIAGRWMVDLPGEGGNVDYWAHFVADGQDQPVCKKIIAGKRWIAADRDPRCQYCEKVAR